MKKREWLCALAVLVLALAGATACAESGNWYIQGITSDRVHMREKPDGDSRSLGLYFQGTEVERHSAYFNTEWVYVRIGAEEGYVYRECLTMQQPEPIQPAYCISNPQSSWVHLRSAPTTQSDSLGRYDNGTHVSLLGETVDRWCYVRIGGQTGYMMSSMLTPLQQEQQTSRVTEVVGHTSDGWLIHAYQAPNGQMLYFTALESEVNILHEDVNFDGQQDLVMYVSLGASNAYCEFFVWDGGRYEMVEHPGIGHGLCNYQLHPGKNMVSTHANNGNAGAMYEDCVFRWDGPRLRLIRRAVGEEYTERSYAQEKSVLTTYNRRLQITVRDYIESRYEGMVIYKKTFDLDGEIECELELASQKLWEGL